MPNAIVLEEKKKIVEELTEKLKCQAGVFINYKGINVNDDTEMRVKLCEANIDYTVIKNSMMRFAIRNVGFEELDPILNGTTSLAVSKDDPIAPARVIKEYADKFNDFFEIKGGFMDGRVLSVNEVVALAKIPPLPVLQAQLLGTMLAPIASLAVVLKAVAERDAAPADAQAATPAEEPIETAVPEETAQETKEAAAETEEVTAAEATQEAAEPESAEAPAEESVAAEAVQETTETEESEVSAPAEESPAEASDAQSASE